MTLLFEASRELPLVQLAVTFHAGGVYDPPGLEGLARITARMLRRGTRTMTGEALEERVDAIGAELAAHVGLGVGTVGIETVTRSVEEATAIVSEVLAEPRFDEAELARLKRQVEAEIVASRDDDEALGARALRGRLFAGHPHGRRVQGTIASVRRITLDDVERHYRRAFCKRNAVLAVGGDLDEETAERLATTAVSGLPEGEILAYPAAEPARREGGRLLIVDKPDRSQCQLTIGTLGADPRDDDYPALVVANTIFGGTFTSRLNQEIRVKRGWSYGASSGLATGRVREAFTIASAPSSEDAGACLALELELLEQLVERGVEESEVGFAREYLRRSHAFEVDTGKKRLQQKLDAALLGVPADFHESVLARVADVGAREASAAVSRRLDPRCLQVVAVATAAEHAGALNAVRAWDVTEVEPHDRD